jgi:hypothetical protein
MDTQKDENSPGEVKRRPFVRLDRPVHVKRLLNKCINQTMAGTMTTDMLRAISYSCQTVLKVFELTTVEERLARVEELLMGDHK